MAVGERDLAGRGGRREDGNIGTAVMTVPMQAGGHGSIRGRAFIVSKRGGHKFRRPVTHARFAIAEDAVQARSENEQAEHEPGKHRTQFAPPCMALQHGPPIPKPSGAGNALQDHARPQKQAGLNSAIQRAKADAKAAVVEATGDPEATSGLEDLRWHDLRGTAATNFLRAGLELSEVATIMGWEPQRVREIALRYVTSEEVGLAMAERLRRNAKATEF